MTYYPQKGEEFYFIFIGWGKEEALGRNFHLSKTAYYEKNIKLALLRAFSTNIYGHIFHICRNEYEIAKCIMIESESFTVLDFCDKSKEDYKKLIALL